MLRRLLGLALVAGLFSLLAPPRVLAQDSSAEALLAKHRAFVGWQLDDGTFKTLRLTRHSVNADGKITEQTTESRVGIVYRNTYRYPVRPGIVEDSGYTGNVFWSSGENGFTTPVYGELAKFLLSYALLFNEGTTALKGVARGTVTVAGKEVETLRLDVPHADPIDVDVDPNTGAYVRAIIDPEGDYETTVQILSYSEIRPGKRLIGSFRVGDGSGGNDAYTKIEPNVAVSDSDLHPPPARASWSFVNPKPFPIVVTPTRVLVDATVNGVKGRFILDTGASSIFLNERFADRAKVAKIGAGGTAVSLYGAERVDIRRADSIEIGGNTLTNAVVEAQDFNARDYWGLDRQNYDGLLGYDVFAAAVVRLDFQAATMTITDPQAQLGDPPGLPIVTDTASNRVPAIPMTLNGSLAVNAMLDTGNPATIIFGPDLLYKYHLRMARRITNVLGMGSIECGNVETLQVGPITYGGEAACKLESGLISGRKILVGLDFLRHFTVVFDYPQGRLFLQPSRR